MNVRPRDLNKAYFWAPALQFSTLLEVTKAGTIHVHASCTRPTRCTPVLLGFKGVEWGSKLCMHIVIASVCGTYFGAPYTLLIIEP